ncbi:endoglucanase 2-like [Gossypium hirsutum]|uniref:cellulase n=1 Tax=Gossypium hirsutum TaxID=3635 RepID=A0ABM2Z949_GOSHI|nr:endoglucanase 2-like [Gossypium hirsutum]
MTDLRTMFTRLSLFDDGSLLAELQPGLKREVTDFVAHCLTCHQDKAEHQLPSDQLTKSAHFIPVKTDYSLQKLAKLYISEIVRLHRVLRGDSALTDGSEAKLDLSKGLYDAGDHVKFGFPMAFTATVLSWAILEYRDQMEAVNQLEPAQQALKWITDFLLNAHPSQNVLYIQVGDPVTDHKCWDRPENMTEKRPLTQVIASVPGTEVAAETAAAMASASLVFKTADSTYSSTLLTHAKQLFTFADNNRGSYSEKIPEVATYYNSTGYGDELLWAASWLYHVTADQSYLEYVTGENGKEFAQWGSPTWFSWDNKLAGTQVRYRVVEASGCAGGRQLVVA